MNSPSKMLLTLSILLAVTGLYGQNTNARCKHQALQPSAIIPAFRVNDFNGWATQSNTSVASDGQGNALIIWTDDRNGISEIYGQVMKDGIPKDPNFKIAEVGLSGGAKPIVQMNDAGHFVVIWKAPDNDQITLITGDISPFSMNELKTAYTSDNFFTDPAVAMAPDGSFVIAWREINADWTEHTIFAKSFDASGERVTDQWQVNKNTHINWSYEPQVSIETGGNIAITWMERYSHSGNKQILLRCFNPGGQPLCQALSVNDTLQTQPQFSQDMAILSTGANHLVFWRDAYLYGQEFTTNGDRVGAKTQIGTATPSSFQFTELPNSQYALAWIENSIHLQIYGDTFTPQGDAIPVDFNVSDPSISALTYDGNNRVIVAATGKADATRSDWDIQAGVIDITTGTMNTYSPLNDDTQIGKPRWPYTFIFADAQGRFIVGWDADRQNYDARRYDAQGALINNLPALDDLTQFKGIHRHNLHIDGAQDGSFITAWNDCSSPDGLIYQRFDANGSRIGGNRLVPECGKTDNNFHLSVNSQGHALFSWNGGDGTHFQVVDDQDQPQFANLPQTQAFLASPETGMDDIGHGLLQDDGSIILMGGRTSESKVYVQRVTAAGEAEGARISISADSLSPYTSGDMNVFKKAESDHIHTFFKAISAIDGKSYLYYQCIDGNGEPMGGNVRLSRMNTMDCDDQGRTAIIWTVDGDIYGRTYQLGEGFQGETFMVHQDNGAYHIFPHVAVRNGNIYVTWCDNHILNRGFNAYAAVLSWAAPTDVELITLPQAFTLHPAYPNPFNPQTVISYTLPRAGKVKTEIFDVLGRRVKTLVDDVQQAGRHTLTWTPEHLPSGVYLCRTVFGKTTKIQKLILQK